MANDIQFRRPKIGPYLSRFRNHWAWNAKSLLTPRQALHDRVHGKVVLLTGASSGIGEGVADDDELVCLFRVGVDGATGPGIHLSLIHI